MVSNNTYHELLLEVLSTHKYLTWKHVTNTANEIINLNLNQNEYYRLIIHTYQNGWIGRNSKEFNLKLDELIHKEDYSKIKELVSQFEICWPEYNKIQAEDLPLVKKYYHFMRNLIYTVLDDNLIQYKILDFNEMLKVQYHFQNDSKCYYDSFLKDFKENGGKIPSFSL